MSKWGKVLLIGTLLWQIPVILWLFRYTKPNTNIIMNLPESVFMFAAMYAFYAIVFGFILTWKYIADPTGKGILIETLKKGGGEK